LQHAANDHLMLAHALESAVGTTIANRYNAARLIGNGGSAAVYEVIDSTSGKPLALKWLLPELAAQPEAALRFRREYATLAQLRHPLVIRAYDYGVDEQRPYYTMDLLSGEDLRGMAPLEWRAACALLRDVASALAIVHSRRLVHRDVSARNVRRTHDGRAKLLDFGALCPMGGAYEVVGTAPFVSPEQLAAEPLDARSDLFSLGALAYHLLTGRHAFPAASFAELYGTWSRRVEAPSAIAADIPEALDSLVLSLLSLNPLARPGSAAELFDRLTGIAGLPPGDARESAQAYLVTPTLVAREDVVVRFRRRLLQAERRRGSTLVIEAHSGLGRSRLLASLLTEAKLRGMLAVYAEGEEGQRGPFAVAHALVRRLRESEPLLPEGESAMKSGTRIIAAGARVLSAEEAIAPEDWPTTVDTISDWIIAFAARMPLALGVDDVDACDEPSLAVLAKVADAAPSRQLVLIASAEPGSKRPAVERLRAAGSSQVLRPLRAAETRQLVSSVFGDVPHVDGVAEWVHRLAEGSPRTSLELSQHLVDRGLARYEQGGWVLPSSLEGLSLPESVHQALEAKIAALRPLARKLADGLALTADDEPLKLEEYAALLDDGEQVFDALNELVAASILVGQGSTYVFANKSIKRGLESAMSAERRRELQGRLATAYAPSSSVLAAYHHFLAGEQSRAFSVLVAFIANRSEQVFRGISFARSEAGAGFYDQLFEWGVATGAPARELLLLGRSVLSLASAVDTRLARHAPTILNQLRKDIGLVYWDEFEGVADPLERIRSCVGRAFAVREATPERERGFDPVKAIGEFAACTAMLAGVGSRTADPDGVSALQENMNRLRPLSPVVDVFADVVAYTALALRGWEVADLRLGIVDRLAGPLPGLDETYRDPLRMTTMYYQALAEAISGDETMLERIAVLEGHPPFAPLVWQVRMVSHLYKGAGKQTEVCRRKRDLALVGRLDVDRQLETSLVHEVIAYMLLADLMALKRVLPVLEERARKWSGWMPHYLLARGTYLGLRGDLGSALDLCRRAVTLVEPGKNVMWFIGMNRVVRLMLQLGLNHESRDLARSSLEVVAKYPAALQHVFHLDMALAIAEARTGEQEAARRRAERVLAQAESTGTRGIVLIELLVGQAQIAQALNDEVAFAAASKQISEMCEKVDSIAFATKLSSLLRLPLGAGFEPVDSSPATINARTNSSQIDARLRTDIELCRGAEERAKRVLTTVLRHAGISQGFLYLNQPEGPTLVASRSNEPPPSELDEYLLKCVRSAGGGGSEQTETTGAGAGPFGSRFVFLAISTQRAEQPVTAAIAMLDCQGARPRIVRDTVLSVLAEALIDAGDVQCE
jgi:serine/threonine-protein kinase